MPTLQESSLSELAAASPRTFRETAPKVRAVSLCQEHANLAVKRVMSDLPSIATISLRANGTARCVCCHAYRANCSLVKIEWKRVVAKQPTPRELVECYLGGVLIADETTPDALPPF